MENEDFWENKPACGKGSEGKLHSESRSRQSEAQNTWVSRRTFSRAKSRGYAKEDDTLRRAILLFLVGITVALVLCIIRGGAVGYTVALADGFFISAVAELSLYALMYVRARGGFDAIAYSVGLFFPPLIKGAGSYGEFCERRRRRRAPKEALFSGGALFALAVLSAALAVGNMGSAM